MSLVVDASAIVDLVIGRPEPTVLLMGEDLHAPAHLDVEVNSALRGLVLRSSATDETADRGRSSLASLAIVRHLPQLLMDRAWELRESIAIPDGVHVALAERLTCPLLTTDDRLARAASAHIDVIAPGLN